MSNFDARERYRTAVETLARFRSVTEGTIQAVGLALAGEVILLFLGFPRFGTAHVTCAVIFAVGVYWYHAAKRAEELKPLPCTDPDCLEEGDGEVAETFILNPWVCGFCDKTHPSIQMWWHWRRSTLVDPCENCTRRQHSVICWRCRKPIIWDEEAYRRAPNNSASQPGYPPLELSPEPQQVPEDRPPRFIDEDLR
jgi:hypothetical protein